MKKQVLLLAIISIGFTNIWAQTTLQYSVHALKAGIDNPMSYCNYSDPGIAGKDQTWDFSQLKIEKPFTGYLKISDYTDFQSTFPQSNTVLEEFNSLFYLKVTTDEIDQYGYSSADGKSKIIYTKPFVKMRFPFALGDIYSGTIIGTSEVSGSSSGNITGTYTVEADGNGKLILPGNIVFEDVLRVKTIKSYDNQLPEVIQHVDIITYRWYNSVHRFPLLVLTEYTTSTGGEKSINYQAAYNSDAVHASLLTANKLDDNITLFPNPVKSELNMTFDSPGSGNMNIEIFDLEGRQIKSFNLSYSQGSNNLSLSRNISGLKPGPYILQIKAGSSKITKDFTLVK
jgi:hypothetical protein